MRKYLKEVHDDHSFVLGDKKIRDIEGLFSEIKNFSDEGYSHFASENHNYFADWIQHVIKHKDLAEALRNTTSKDEAVTLLEKEISSIKDSGKDKKNEKKNKEEKKEDVPVVEEKTQNKTEAFEQSSEKENEEISEDKVDETAEQIVEESSQISEKAVDESEVEDSKEELEIESEAQVEEVKENKKEAAAEVKKEEEEQEVVSTPETQEENKDKSAPPQVSEDLSDVKKTLKEESNKIHNENKRNEKILKTINADEKEIKDYLWKHFAWDMAKEFMYGMAIGILIGFVMSKIFFR